VRAEKRNAKPDPCGSYSTLGASFISNLAGAKMIEADRVSAGVILTPSACVGGVVFLLAEGGRCRTLLIEQRTRTQLAC